MRPTTRVLDRVITGFVGLLLLAGGGWALAYRLGQRQVTDANRRISTKTIDDLPNQPWWPAVVGVTGAILVLVALWLLVRHLRSAASRTVVTDGGGTVELNRVADAVAADLTRNPLIRRARTATLVEKGRPLIRVSVTVPPEASVDELSALAVAARREVRAATNPEVGLQILVNDEDSSSGAPLERRARDHKARGANLLEK